MGSGFLTSMVTVLTAITGIAVIAVLVSKNAQTPAVLNSFWGGFSQSIQAATGPVTGNGGSNSGILSGISQGAGLLGSFGSTANLI